MTKTELKQLIKECLNEVVDPKYTEYSSIPDPRCRSLRR